MTVEIKLLDSTAKHRETKDKLSTQRKDSTLITEVNCTSRSKDLLCKRDKLSLQHKTV